MLASVRLLLTIGLFAALAASAAAETPYPFRLESIREGAGATIFARNDGNVPVSVIAKLDVAENVASDRAWPVAIVVPARGTARLGRVYRADPKRSWKLRYNYSYRAGAFTAVHDSSARYRMPYLDGRTFVIGQAPGGRITTHKTSESRYAIDIPMPEGTPIIAARGGVVMTSESKFVEGGKVDALKDKANAVQIVHSDGTIATYAHLMTAGAAVQVGDIVEAGKLLGYAGSTGYSSGPHLHFAVTRVVLAGDKFDEVSEPILFYLGNPPYSFSPKPGLAVTANYVSAGKSPERMNRDTAVAALEAWTADTPVVARAPNSRPPRPAPQAEGTLIVFDVSRFLAVLQEWWWMLAGLLCFILIKSFRRSGRRRSFADSMREPTLNESLPAIGVDDLQEK